MRARDPDHAGYVARDGVRVYYEVHGRGTPTILLMPALIPLRHWKMQIPHLARHYRVVAFDPRGNGRSDRPGTVEAYADREFVDDARAVMEETGTETAILAGISPGVQWSVLLAARDPDRVLGIVALAPGVTALTPPHPHRIQYSFDDALDTEEGWAKQNRHYWRRNYRGWLEFLAREMVPEPHSTRLIEDLVAWGLESNAETQLLVWEAVVLRGPILPAQASTGRLASPTTREEAEAVCRRVRCPVLVIHGDQDRGTPWARGARLAELTAGRLVTLRGSGHLPHARHPVVVNMAIREFVDTVVPPQPRHVVWERAMSRPRRALFVSSSIGLGHIQRDLAVARELRALVPDLEIHWWAQPPATSVLEAAGERLHPLCFEQAQESAHWEEESRDHELHAFYAWRRMDEIFYYNFMLFHDATRETPYDLWIGDESWEVDYYLHENPELKCAPYAYLTDVIGFLPVDPEGDPREAELTADYNAEMIEHRARFPYIRDLSLYIGEYEELPDAAFGPGLPRIRDWARRWFESVPYILPFDPAAYADREELRRRLGYGTGYPLLIAAVGGTAVGHSLLVKVAEAFALLQHEIPDARMIMVTGPRIASSELPDVAGLDKRGYVHNLFEHLACADAAVVQGGLSTAMELVALGRPFAYFPLRHHWEQVHHVSHRLSHYGARLRVDYATASSADVKDAMARALREPVAYRPVPRDGARHAAERIARLLVNR
jgi:pimeloyl-ACP methyl ester carboxylesterase/UDP-N-acetylglucosamine:LPS N-acetylglucosamine transferase